MKIGIIGAGNIGGTLTRRLSALGHQVSVANSREPETLADLAAETGATATTPEDAANGAELVIVTIPQKNVPELPAGLLDRTAVGFTNSVTPPDSPHLQRDRINEPYGPMLVVGP